jgi:hypothetical protein
MKTLKRIVLTLLVLALLVFSFVWILLRTEYGQVQAGKWVSSLLTKELATELSIERVRMQSVDELILQEVLIKDHKGDTLIHAGQVELGIGVFLLKKRLLNLEDLKFIDGELNMITHQGDEKDGLMIWIEALAAKKSLDAEPWSITMRSAALQNFRFRRWNENKDLQTGRLDLDHLDFRDLDLQISGLEIVADKVSAHIDGLKGNELNSKLDIVSFESDFLLDNTHFQFMQTDLETAKSALSADIALTFKDFSEISELSDSLGIQVDLRKGRFSSEDLRFVIPEFESLSLPIQVSAEISGQLSDLLLRDLHLEFGASSRLIASGRLTDIMDRERFTYQLDIHELASSSAEVQKLLSPELASELASIPYLSDLGRVTASSEINGDLRQSSINLEVISSVGELSTTSRINFPRDGIKDSYIGTMDLRGLRLGDLMGIPELKVLDAHVDYTLQGLSEDPKVQVKGAIQKVLYKGFSYRDIQIDAQLEKGLFNGDLFIDHEAVSLDFNGIIDTRSEIPSFDFTSSIKVLELHTLGFVAPADTMNLVGNIIAEFSGNDADNFKGDITLEDVIFSRGKNDFKFEDINLHSDRTDIGRGLSFRSTPLDIEIHGDFVLKDLPRDIKNIFSNVIPNLDLAEASEPSSSDLEFQAFFNNPSVLTDAFFPDWSLSENTIISGFLRSQDQRFFAELKSDSIGFGKFMAYQVSLEASQMGKMAYILLENKEFELSETTHFLDNVLTMNFFTDTVETDLTWSLKERQASGSISAKSIFHSKDSISNFLNPSLIVLSGDYWVLPEVSSIGYYNKEWHVENVMVENAEEKIIVDGVISSDPLSKLDFKVDRFQLAHLNQFIPDRLMDWHGVTDIQGSATSVLGALSLVSEMSIEGLTMGNELIGDLDLNTTWDKGDSFLFVNGGVTDQDRREIQIDGKYYPDLHEGKLEATLAFDEFDLSLLNKLKTKAISEIGGTASGTLNVAGSLLEPEISGKLMFNDAKVRVDYLNTRYTFSNEVIIEKDWMGFNYIPFQDEYGNRGNINGTVIHENFRNWNYDFFADFEKMLCLNTNKDDNELYYGKVFVSGSISLSGFDQNLDIEVHGKTEKGTSLVLPLGSRDDVVFEDYIYFKSTEGESPNFASSSALDSGIKLFIEADITPDADIKLVFDQQIGDIMEGKGQGVLTMSIDRGGDFEMYGRYSVLDGSYLFTLQNIINKQFTVAPGGTISFFGNPYQAELDIQAIYDLRASLVDLLGSSAPNSGRIPVETMMTLTGPMLNPDISFSILLPTSDPATQAVVQSRLSTEQELNRQIFALLVLNKFMPAETSSIGEVATGASNTTTEFVSSQLSNWLSQLSSEVDVGVNYRARDQLNSEELAVALTTQLFKDRLLLTGNFGVQGQNDNVTGSAATSLIGDFRLEYMITPDGRLRLKVFNETNQFDILNLDQAPTKQGVGLIFQREFDGKFRDTSLL